MQDIFDKGEGLAKPVIDSIRDVAEEVEKTVKELGEQCWDNVSPDEGFLNIDGKKYQIQEGRIFNDNQEDVGYVLNNGNFYLNDNGKVKWGNIEDYVGASAELIDNGKVVFDNAADEGTIQIDKKVYEVRDGAIYENGQMIGNIDKSGEYALIKSDGTLESGRTVDLIGNVKIRLNEVDGVNKTLAYAMDTVSKRVVDGPYRWTAKYDIELLNESNTVRVTCNVNFDPAQGVSEEKIKEIEAQTSAIVESIWSNQYGLKEKNAADNAKIYTIDVDVRFTDARHADQIVNVLPGDGRDNMTNWYADSDAQTRAHEFGHMLGQVDEYYDPTSPNRVVYTDNSIMGNYYVEGMDTASAKPRHFVDFANWLSDLLGTEFEVVSLP